MKGKDIVGWLGTFLEICYKRKPFYWFAKEGGQSIQHSNDLTQGWLKDIAHEAKGVEVVLGDECGVGEGALQDPKRPTKRDRLCHMNTQMKTINDLIKKEGWRNEDINNFACNQVYKLATILSLLVILIQSMYGCMFNCWFWFTF